MNSKSIFSQAGLDALLGVNQKNPTSPGDKSDVGNHPALSSESDISGHQALTNQFSDTSRFSSPTSTPSSNQVTNMHQPGERRSNTLVGTHMATQAVQGIPDSPNDGLSTANSNQGRGVDPVENMFGGLIQTIFSNAQLSQQFCDQLITTLCQNTQFMKSLRSSILEKLLSSDPR